MVFTRWRREVYRRFRRSGQRPSREFSRPKPRPLPHFPQERKGRLSPLQGGLISCAIGLLLAGLIIAGLEARLRPVVYAVAQTQAVNTLTGLVEQVVAQDIAQREIGYDDFVTIQRDDSGAIAALGTDMAKMNLLRTEITGEILAALEEVDVSTIQIPLGSLLQSELSWGRGPSVKVRSMSVGVVSAEFESEFHSAGINQTLHRIYLEIQVPITLMLPGGGVETDFSTRLCVAETVIVGAVPEMMLQRDTS